MIGERITRGNREPALPVRRQSLAKEDVHL
jgi:hypothetical protein